MAKVSKKERLARFYAQARAEFADIIGVQLPAREQALNDREFAHVRGAQWNNLLGEQFVNRPKIEINKVAQALDQIESDYRDNQMDVQLMSRTGALNTSLATSMESVYRSDITDKGGMRAYLNGFREGIAGGMGAWHVQTCYEAADADPDREDEAEDSEGEAEDDSEAESDGAEVDEGDSGTPAAGADEDEDEHYDEPQRVKLEPIFDADKFLFYDLDARKDDKSDARRCYLLCPLTRKEYERRYPDRDPSSWPEEVNTGGFQWVTPDVVYLASIYDVEYVPDVELTYRPPSATLDGAAAVSDSAVKTLWKSDVEDEPEKEKDLLALGYVRIRKRKVRRKRVHKYLVDGLGVIKDCGLIVGPEIPIVPFYAKRFYINNIEHFHGHVRFVRDPQQVKNALVSKLLEGSAISAFEVPIMTVEQYEGHEEVWAGANIELPAFMPINGIINPDGEKVPLGPVGWTKSPQVPPVTGALHTLVDADLTSILGNFEEVSKTKSHVPGKAMDIVERHVSPMTKLYLHNMSEAVRRTGEIWLGIAPEIYYQKGRKLKGTGPRNEVQEVELYKPMMRDDVYTEENDFSRAKFDVMVKVGPYSETEEEAAVEQGLKTAAVTEDPQTKLVMMLHTITNMRGPNSQPIQKWARGRLVEMGVYEPTPEEARMLEQSKANAQPTPMDQLVLAQAAEAQAKAQNSDAQRALTLARAQQTQASVAKTEADTQKVLVDTQKVIADANLDRDYLAVDAAKNQHDAAMSAAELSTPGQGESKDSSGSA